MEISAKKSCLPSLIDGEYYRHELHGLSVITIHGRKLGTLSDVLETGAQDVYVTLGYAGEILIPAVEEIVKEINIDKGIMVVDLPPGLEDVNVI